MPANQFVYNRDAKETGSKFLEGDTIIINSRAPNNQKNSKTGWIGKM